MATTPLGFPYPALTDAPNVPASIQSLATAIDSDLTETLYTPVLTAVTTNPTLGSVSSIGGGYSQPGKKALGWLKFNFGTSGAAAGSGNYNVTLPFPVAAHYAFEDVIGYGRIKCAGLYTPVHLICYSAGTNLAGLVYYSAAVNGTRQFVNSAGPGAWTNSDGADCNFQYDTA